MEKRSIWLWHHKPIVYMVASRHKRINCRFAFITCKYNKDKGLKKKLRKTMVIGY